MFPNVSVPSRRLRRFNYQGRPREPSGGGNRLSRCGHCHRGRRRHPRNGRGHGRIRGGWNARKHRRRPSTCLGGPLRTRGGLAGQQRPPRRTPGDTVGPLLPEPSRRTEQPINIGLRPTTVSSCPRSRDGPTNSSSRTRRLEPRVPRRQSWRATAPSTSGSPQMGESIWIRPPNGSETR